MSFFKRPWEDEKEWREIAWMVVQSAERCALCQIPGGPYHAMPVDTNRPHEGLMAVCGQCKPRAMQYRVIPLDAVEVMLSPWQEVNRKLPVASPPVPRIPVLVDPQKQAFLDLRKRVIARDHGICQYCGLHGMLIDKVNRFKKFDIEHNWVCCCGECRPYAMRLSEDTVGDKRDMILHERGLTLSEVTFVDRAVPLRRHMKRKWNSR